MCKTPLKLSTCMTVIPLDWEHLESENLLIFVFPGKNTVPDSEQTLSGHSNKEMNL